jgi:hypothetical protein
MPKSKNQTIQALLKDAKKQHRRAEKELEKYDNSDDMREMEAWAHAIAWLERWTDAEE